MNNEKKVILIVEDENILALDTATFLERNAYKTIVVNTGEEAIKLIKKGQKVDLVLMDVNLGKGMTGVEIAKKILSIRELPVVFLSSYSDKDTVTATEEVTSYGYILKNSGEAVMLNSIKMAFRLFETKIAQQKALLEAKENEELFRKMFSEHIAIQLLIDPDNGRIIDANEAAIKFYGWPREKLLAMKIYEINTLPAYEIKKEIEKVRRQEKNFFEFNHRIADGSIKQVQGYSTRIKWKGKDILYSIIHDVTEENLLHQKLIDNERKFRLVFENSPIGIYIARPDGTITDVNPTLLKFLGSPSAEKTKEINLIEFPLLKKANFSANFIKCVKERKIIHYEFPYVSKWGKYSFLSAYFVPIINEKNELESIMGLVEDITARKEAEDKIKKLLDEKDLLLKEVHHRVKNNIVSILALINLLKKSVKTEETVTVLNDMVGRIESMRILYERLIDKEFYREINLKDYLEDLISKIFSVFSGELNIECEQNIQNILLSSKKAFYLGMLLNELLTNIIKHTFKGKKEGKIEITAFEENNQLNLIIVDNGTGLPPDFNIETHEGFGIMLIRLLVQQLGGEIKFESPKSGGTKVEFKFSV